jgi:hypothetical protein
MVQLLLEPQDLLEAELEQPDLSVYEGETPIFGLRFNCNRHQGEKASA